MAAVGPFFANGSLADDQHDPATLVPMDRDTLREELLGSEGRVVLVNLCLLYTSPSPRDGLLSRMPSSA